MTFKHVFSIKYANYDLIKIEMTHEHTVCKLTTITRNSVCRNISESSVLNNKLSSLHHGFMSQRFK